MAEKDAQTVTPQGEEVASHISGVVVHEVRNIVTRNGVTTEFYSAPWQLTNFAHAIHATLHSSAISAWHCHKKQHDHVFVLSGALELAMFDPRENSSTRGQVEVIRLSLFRPRVVRIPPGVWHGLQNMQAETSSFINYFDQPYNHADPDEWRLPWDSPEIPYRFRSQGAEK